MNDKDMARLRAETNFDFGPWISAGVRGFGHVFRVLNRIQYGRPWDRAAPDAASTSRR